MAELTKQALKVENNTEFPNNNNGAITPSNLRGFNVNMIDSLVDEIGYNVDSASWNQAIDSLETNSGSVNISITDLNASSASQQISIDALNVFTSSVVGLSTGSLLVTASASGNTLTFTKGDASQFNVVVATGSIPDITALNQATASLQAYTSSANVQFANLESTTASLNVSVSNINTFTQSVGISITNLNVSSASQQVSIDSLNAATSSYVTSAITASSLITASFDNGNRNLTFTKGDSTTFSVNIPDVSGSAGDFVTTASFNAYTSSTNQRVDSLEINSGSVNVSISNLNSTTGSLNTSISNLNASSASQQVSIDNLNINSGSVNISIGALNTFTASQSTASIVNSITELNSFSASALVSISNLNTTTQSLNTSASLGLTTASFDNGSRNLTFTKGNNTQFSVNIPDVSGSTLPSGVISGSAQITSLGFVSSSVTASSLVTASFDNGTRNLTFTKGDASTFNVNIPDVSGSAGNFVTTASFNAYTQSNDQRVSSLETNSGSVNTSITALNTFTASATESIVTAIVTNVGSNYYQIDGIQAPKLSFVPGPKYRFNLSGIAGNHPFKFSTSPNGPTQYTTGVTSGSGFIQIEVGYNTTTPLYYYCTNHSGMGNEINVLAIDTLVTTASFNAYTASQSTASIVNSITELNTFTQSAAVSITNLNAATASYATTGSNTFIGNQTITGSVDVSGSVKQTFNAPAADTQVDLIAVNGANIDGTAYTNVSFNMQDYPGSGDAYKDAFVIDYWTDFNYATGSEFFVNAKRIGGSLVLSGSTGGVLRNGISQLRDLGGKTFLNQYANLINIGAFAPATTEQIAIGHDALPFLRISSLNNQITGSTIISGSGGLQVTGSVNIQNTITASLQQGFVLVGDSSGRTTTVATSSFGGSTDTGSLLVTGSVAGNVLTFTKGDASTFTLTVDTGSGGGAAFPFTGSAEITGSLGITGSFNTLPITLSVSSDTASIDMTMGNTFILNIPTGSTTHIIPTNIIAGQTINLLVKQAAGATTGSLSYSPIILFPSGLDMIPTSTGSAIDLISMISFDTTNLMAANVKNLK